MIVEFLLILLAFFCGYVIGKKHTNHKIQDLEFKMKLMKDD